MSTSSKSVSNLQLTCKYLLQTLHSFYNALAFVIEVQFCYTHWLIAGGTCALPFMLLVKLAHHTSAASAQWDGNAELASDWHVTNNMHQQVCSNRFCCGILTEHRPRVSLTSKKSGRSQQSCAVSDTGCHCNTSLEVSYCCTVVRQGCQPVRSSKVYHSEHVISLVRA